MNKSDESMATETADLGTTGGALCNDVVESHIGSHVDGFNGPIGIFISMFPERHETFILRELVALERRGVDFTLYSLQRPREEIDIEDAIRLKQQRTRYASLFGLPALMAFAAALLHHPLRTLGAIASVFHHGCDRPVEMAKALAILPISLHFGRLAKQRGISHVHGHWANVPTTACWYLSRIHGFTWSAAIHGEDIFTPNRFLGYKLNDARFTVVCSGLFCRHIQHEIGLHRPENVHLNYHGLDPRVTELEPSRNEVPLAGEAPARIITIGRLVPTKGHDLLIRAIGKLRKEHGVNVRLALIGSGPQESTLQALAAQTGVGDSVDFLGALQFDEVLEQLQQSHVFALAPRMIPGHPPDGIPNVIAEAMALRLPVATTRVSAIPELIDDEKSGLLVEEDDLEGLTSALLRLVEEPALRERLAEAGYQKVSELFDQNRNIDELLGYFNDYLSGKAA